MPVVIVCCADVLICMMIKNSVRQRRAKTAHTFLRPPFWTKEHSICIALDVIKVSIFFITTYTIRYYSTCIIFVVSLQHSRAPEYSRI